MAESIPNKAAMYRMLAAGQLGNSLPQYFSVEEWRTRKEDRHIDVWGVRTLTAGGPCRLFCPADEVAQTVASFAPHAVNISLMVGAAYTVRLMADVWVGVGGLEFYGVVDPPRESNWRQVMPTGGRHYRLSAARAILHDRLNSNALADLYDLLERFPGHVVELSACEECLGVLPGRNAVTWEVRGQSGQYELQSWNYWR